MKSKTKFIYIGLVCLFLVLAAYPAAADFVPCEQKTGDTGNCTLEDLLDVVVMIINYMFSIAGLIAITFVVWGGVQMILANGNPTQIQAGKSTVWHALLGLVLVLAAYMVVVFVIGVFTGNTSYNPYEQVRRMIQ